MPNFLFFGLNRPKNNGAYKIERKINQVKFENFKKMEILIFKKMIDKNISLYYNESVRKVGYEKCQI